MKKLLLQPALIISTLFVIALASGGVYVSIQLNREDRAKDEAVRSAERLAAGHDSAEEIAARLVAARSKAGEELARLDALTNQPSSQLAQAVVSEFAFERVTAAVQTLEIPISASVVVPSVQNQIETIQSQIATILEAWKQVMQNPAVAGTPAGEAAAAAYAEQIRDQLADLQEIVDGLGPEDSGLTPEEIAEYQETIDETIEETDEAIEDVNDEGVPPEVIDDQQEEVDEAEEEVEALEEELEEVTNPTDDQGGSGDGGTGGDGGNGGGQDDEEEFIPPPPPDPSLKPKVIEGANTDY